MLEYWNIQVYLKNLNTCWVKPVCAHTDMFSVRLLNVGQCRVYFGATCLHSHPGASESRALPESFIFFFLSHQEEDVDFLAKFSRLVNGMGQSLVLSWTKLAKTGNVKDAAETLQAIEAKVPLLLQLLVHEDDDISANIVGFCYEYLHVLKQVSSEEQEEWCYSQLHTLLLQLEICYHMYFILCFSSFLNWQTSRKPT